MLTKQILLYPVKVILVAGVMLLGTGWGAALSGLLGLPVPEVPMGLDQMTLLPLFGLANLLLAISLSLLAPHLGGGLFGRSMALGLLFWLAHGVNTAFESPTFVEASAAGGAAALPITIITYIIPAILAGCLTALFFPPSRPSWWLGAAVQEFFEGRSALEWIARLALVILIFAAIDLVLGILVSPLITSSNELGVEALTLSSIIQMLPLLFLRGGIFLLACLPVLILWRGSRANLAASLGFALFVMVGLAWMLGGAELPVKLRVVHTVEILVGSALYALAAVYLLPGGQYRRSWARIG